MPKFPGVKFTKPTNEPKKLQEREEKKLRFSEKLEAIKSTITEEDK